MDMKAHKARRDRAVQDREVWRPIEQQVYDYCIPYRRPKNGSGGEERLAHIFDPTAIISTFRGAGKLQQDLFPPGQPLFRLRPGSLLKARAKAGELDLAKLQLEYDNLTDQVRPFFQTGEWDTATAEFCLELYIGTAVMIPCMGTGNRPLRFLTAPVDECAFSVGPYGDIDGLFWTQQQTFRAIHGQYSQYGKKVNWPQQWLDKLNANPDEPTELRQDFVAMDKGWAMIVSLEHADADDPPLLIQKMKQKPFAGVRYHRVPGEAQGRGPAMLALPFARTANKVMEIILKSSAIQMLGIWAYRPGGTFNPDQVRLAPGQFWPMQSTGGVMGPDVSRVDTSSGRLDVGNIALQELRSQIQQALHDERLPDGMQTPKSASEIMARMAQVKADYIGAYGRMINELVPVIVPRATEILHKKGLLSMQFPIDELNNSIDILSPLAQSLKAERWKPVLEGAQLVASLEGPEAVRRHFDLDQIVYDMVIDMGMDSTYVRTLEQLAQYDAQQQEQQAAAMLAQAAADKPGEMMQAVNGLAGEGGEQQADAPVI